MNIKELFQGKNIKFNEALHSNVCYVTYNNKGVLLHKPFHCKDFYNELWYPHFCETIPCSDVYGFKLKEEIIESITNNVYIVLFKHDKEGNKSSSFIKEINNLENREKIGDYIINAVTMLLGNRNCIKKVKVYNDHIVLNVKTSIFKYPTVNSILMYIFRTALDAGYYNNSNVLELTDILVEKDPVYYMQHTKFKEILISPLLLKNIRLFKWNMFYTYGGPIHESMSLGNLHHSSGFISYCNLIHTNKETLQTKFLIDNKIKLKK